MSEGRPLCGSHRHDATPSFLSCTEKGGTEFWTRLICSAESVEFLWLDWWYSDSRQHPPVVGDSVGGHLPPAVILTNHPHWWRGRKERPLTSSKTYKLLDEILNEISTKKCIHPALPISLLAQHDGYITTSLIQKINYILQECEKKQVSSSV